MAGKVISWNTCRRCHAAGVLLGYGDGRSVPLVLCTSCGFCERLADRDDDS